MRYLIAHVISSPAGAVKTARLIVSDVPDKTPRAEVIEALGAAGYGAKFAEGGVPFGNHDVIAEGRAGWPKGVASIEAAEQLAWSRLITPPRRNEGKRVTLRLTDAEHGTFALAAQRAGVSLQEWCVRVLLAAADQAAPVPAAPRRAAANGAE